MGGEHPNVKQGTGPFSGFSITKWEASLQVTKAKNVYAIREYTNICLSYIAECCNSAFFSIMPKVISEAAYRSRTKGLVNELQGSYTMNP